MVSRSLLPPGVVTSKLSVRFEEVVKLPTVRLPTAPMPPGAMVDGPEPAWTLPEIEPPLVGSLASVPPLKVTVPLPVAEPLLPLAATSVPLSTSVPPL